MLLTGLQRCRGAGLRPLRVTGTPIQGRSGPAAAWAGNVEVAAPLGAGREAFGQAVCRGGACKRIEAGDKQREGEESKFMAAPAAQQGAPPCSAPPMAGAVGLARTAACAHSRGANGAGGRPAPKLQLSRAARRRDPPPPPPPPCRGQPPGSHALQSTTLWAASTETGMHRMPCRGGGASGRVLFRMPLRG